MMHFGYYNYSKFLFFYNILLPVWVNTELYTAITELKKLLETEDVLIGNLEKYITVQQQTLDSMKKYVLVVGTYGTIVLNSKLIRKQPKTEERRIRYYTTEHEKAKSDAQEYLDNPINAYLLVKRLTTDWEITEKMIENDLLASERLLENIIKMKDDFEFPTEEDLNGAAAALIRLQTTYHLNIESIALKELNARDCFELGRHSYYNQDYNYTVKWMEEALRKYETEKNYTMVHKWEILEYLAFSFYMQGNVEVANQFTGQILELNPNHTDAQKNLDYFKSILHKDNNEAHGDIKKPPGDPETLHMDHERMKYFMLCRKDIQLPPHVQSKLKCRYVDKNNPYLKIAPLKEEEAYLEPRILLYRDIMYPNEIEIVKQLAHSKLQRAAVLNRETGQKEFTKSRISKSAWLDDEEHSTVANVRQRVSDITSLTVETAEELQIVNYGIGGHYEPHFDFTLSNEKNSFKLGTGNRIATVLFYMSDVAKGGATVFPELDLALWPEKGTAAFWMNLHSSGVGDHSTKHAACPVLLGSKWVSNVWLHESGQEFLHPCDPSDADKIY